MTSKSGNTNLIICCGMYRSASTWQYLIASDLVETAGLGTRSGFLDDSLLEQLTREQSDNSQVRVIKVHEYRSIFGDLIDKGCAKAIYSLRDIRDVACSIMWKLNQPFESDSVRSMLKSAIDAYYRWTNQADVLVQRYEFIMDDPSAAVFDIARYIDAPTNRKHVLDLVDKYSRKANRERAKEFSEILLLEGKDLSHPKNALIWDPQTLLHWNHIRPDGQASWQSVLDYHQLRFLDSLYSRWLIDAGYEKDDMWLSRWLDNRPGERYNLRDNSTRADDKDENKELDRMSSEIIEKEAGQTPKGFISYAQNFEDVILWRALKHIRAGFYIDVGAWDPEQDSITRAFYERDWRGINIEPVKAYHVMLEEIRTEDINLGVALAQEPGLVDFHVVEGTGLSTLNPDLATQYEADGLSVRVESCPALTLDIVWEKHVRDREVHFMSIDVEGFEEQIIRGNKWSAHRPWIVVVEATKPNTQLETHEAWEPILLDSGYSFVYADGLNRFYLAREHEELSSLFQFPPNYFDHFKVAAQVNAEVRAAKIGKALSAEKQTRIQAQARADKLAEKLDEARDQLEQSRQQENKARDQLEQSRQQENEAREQLEHSRQREKTIEQVLNAEKKERAQAQTRAEDFADELEGVRQQLHGVRQRATELEYQVSVICQSKSWRMTHPLRVAMMGLRTAKAKILSIPVRLVRSVKNVGKVILTLLMRFVLARPRLKSVTRALVKKFPLVESRLHRLAVERGLIKVPQPLPAIQNKEILPELSHMSENARHIYHDLKKAFIENRKRE